MLLSFVLFLFIFLSIRRANAQPVFGWAGGAPAHGAAVGWAPGAPGAPSARLPMGSPGAGEGAQKSHHFGTAALWGSVGREEVGEAARNLGPDDPKTHRR